jgi:hypothetical protein
MYKCFKCNKEFQYESKLNEHNSRKTLCDKIKTELKCDICNIFFKCPYNQKIHETTKKHILNVNNYTVNSNNKLPLDYKDLQNKLDTIILKNNELLNKNNDLQNKLDTIILKNNELLNENKLLKLNSNINLDHHEQIYIIHERTFVELNTNIYKIGKTKNIKNRLNGYTKGSKLLFTIACKDCTESENKILNFLKNNDKYIHAKEYGNEYFQCNLQDLMIDIHNLILNSNIN